MPTNKNIRTAFLFFCLFLVLQVQAFGRTGEVARVFDGDTVILKTGETLRILGIDAPEIGRGGEASGWYARESSETLRRLVLGKQIDWKGAKPDQYGRILSRIEISEGDVAEIMVRKGCAWYYPHMDQPMGFGPELLMAQQEAMESGAGMWGKFLPWARKRGPVVGNRRSWRFFPEQSPEVARISPHNRLRFSSMEEAFRAGFAPARGLGLWPAFSDIEKTR